MKKILLLTLVLMSFVACSNPTSHNDGEPVYTPATTSDNDSTQVDDEYYMEYHDYYTCDYWLYHSSDDNYTYYSHYVATESNPVSEGAVALNGEMVVYDKNQCIVPPTGPMALTCNFEEGYLETSNHDVIKLHKVGRSWLDESGNTVLRYLKTECIDIRDPANPTWKVFD